jgi:polysaccharide pyruvyl transferase WcaK-like protein/Uri superfamily endonuclease
MTDKKLKIAFSGVFDLANYGDHLFPIVFKAMMETRGLDVALFLFSPIACNEALNEDNVPVYALSDLEKMHLDICFDVIIVGGGGIIHFFDVQVKTTLDTEQYSDYPIYQTWLIPSLVAHKYDLPLIWNSPGITFRQEGMYSHLTKAFCDDIDYLSVRNSFSMDVLLECGVQPERINLSIDSAFAISQIPEVFALRVEADARLKGNYIVFHTNRFISEDDIPVVVELMDSLAAQGYKIVLLPLAYTHGDDIILKRINQISGERYIIFDKTLHFREMMNILAGCTLYIGTSFHGAITAIAYGKKAVAFDFMHNTKTKDLFQFLGLESNYLCEVEKLKNTVKRVLQDDSAPNLMEIQSILSTHFDNISKILRGEYTRSNRTREFTTDLIKGIADSEGYLQLKASLDWYIVHAKNQQEHIENQNKQIEVLNESLNWHIDHVKKQQEHSENQNKQIEVLNESLDWHIDYVKKQQEHIEYQNKQMEELRESNTEEIQRLNKKIVDLQQTICEMETSFPWRITRFLRKYK